MTLGPGSRLGPYEITAKLGEGGMGEVWRARDSRLGSEVALKLLPEAFGSDPERLARFEREAKALASLNHPNVAQIYGLEASGDGRALVMELVEGPTLAARIAQGALPLADCLAVARQIAEGLEEAHEKGIVHRDLKPANISLTADDRVKVLDFGLAKAMEPGTGGSGALSGPAALMNSPTLTAAHGTALGVILGTAAYMAPEQAKGAAVDRRADIWAFGAVLWEMLTGRRAFAGETTSETLAAVLRDEVDWRSLPAATPPDLTRLLRRCLERDPKRRLRDIGEARLELERLAGSGSPRDATAPDPHVPAATSRQGGVAVGLALALLAAGAVAGWLVARATRSGPALAAAIPRPSFRQLTKAPGGERTPSLSPDGESFVFVKRDGGDHDLFVQRIDGTRAIALTADCAENDFDPAFSPDGRSIAYRSECGGGGIFVMGATGESNRRVTDFGFAPAWSPDGRELALVTERLESPTSRNSTSELWAVRVDSGERRRVSTHDAMGPTWSPDGRRIAFWGLRGESFQRDLWSVAADGSESAPEAAVPLLDDKALDWAPVYSRDGRWLYFASTRGGTFNLWRLAIDPARGTARGEPEALTAPSSWAGPFAVSADGRRIVFVDRNAETEIVRAPLDLARPALAANPTAVFSGSFELREQALSPSGDWLLFTNEDPPQQLHLVRPDGTGYRQLTTEGDRNRQGAWSPRGDWIVFQTTRGDSSLAAIHPDGGGWQTVPVGFGHSTPSWSPDGSTIASFDNTRGGLLFDIRSGLDKPVGRELPPVAPGVLFWPISWSPDGALLAGRATRAGQTESLVVYSPASGGYQVFASGPAMQVDFNLEFVDRHRLASIDGRDLWLRDVRGGEPVLLFSAPPGHQLHSISASHDGRWLTWIDRTDESDIWLMTLEETPHDASGPGAGARP